MNIEDFVVVKKIVSILELSLAAIETCEYSLEHIEEVTDIVKGPPSEELANAMQLLAELKGTIGLES